MKKRKSIEFIVVLFAVFFIFTLSAYAALEVRGTDSQGNKLIYDTDLNVTWYDYTRGADTYYAQSSWADNLDVNYNGIVISDWRLTELYCGGSCLSADGDILHLSLTELGNQRYSPVSNTGPFDNLSTGGYYWQNMSSGSYQDPDHIWLATLYGKIVDDFSESTHLGLAVRTGDIAAVVPEPISSILFVTGGALLAGKRFIRRKA